RSWSARTAASASTASTASRPETCWRSSRPRKSRERCSAPDGGGVSAARVAIGTVELHFPDVLSLKGKRHVLKGLKEKVRARFEVAVAEVDHHDMWQRATLA